MELFGVGAGEALLVLVITLIVVGPQRFPEIAREGGRWFRMARRFTAEITADVRSAIDELEEEVAAEGDELRSIREIGTEVESGLRESAADIRRIGRETDADATVAIDGAGAEASSADAATSPAARRETAVKPTAPRPDIAELQRPRTAAEMQKQLADAYRGVREGAGARPATSSAASTSTGAAASTNGAATSTEGEAAAPEPPLGE